MKSIAKRNAFLPQVFQGLWDTDLFYNFYGNTLPGMPAINVMERENDFIVDISMPGLDKKDVEVEVDNSYLLICAKNERKSEERDAKNRIIRQEFNASSFERKFALPENIDTENIVADLNNGILKITLPKKENAPEDKVKIIAVG